MAAKRIWILVLGVTALGGVAIAGVRRYCARPGYVAGIPSRDYQYRTRSRPEMVVSKTALLLRRIDTAKGEITKQVRVYQLDRPKLTIDHCSISRVALQIHDNHFWVMSLRADQNPVSEDGETEAVTEDGLYVAHLKRNQFVVKVRAYGAFTQEEERADETTGKPVLFELEPMQFWVQRGRPYDFWKQGRIICAPELLDLVDRVELEFFYR